MLKKYVNCIKHDLIPIGIIILFVILGFGYVHMSARDIVFMDFWRNIVEYIEPTMQGTLTWTDIWKGAFGQRNPLQFLLLVWNIKYLNLNCLWEEYAGIVVMGLETLVLLCVWRKTTKEEYESTRKKCNFLFLPIIVITFSLNQWEIVSLQFSFVFQIRLFTYLLAFIFIDQALKVKKERMFGIAGIWSGILICSVSQLYFTGMLIVSCIVMILACYIEKVPIVKSAKYIVLYLLPNIVAVCLYFWNLPMQNAGGSFDAFVKILFNGRLYLGLMYMLVASILPQSVVQTMMLQYVILLGTTLLIIIIGSVGMFLYAKMWRRSYVPIFTLGYGLISIFIIIYGRINEFDLMYLTASRYTCETNFIWIGCSFIWAWNLLEEGMDGRKWGSVLALFCICILVLELDYAELKTAPYRGVYKDNLIEYLKNGKEIKKGDEQIELFQSTEELVIQGVDLMKKYKLNVYHE